MSGNHTMTAGERDIVALNYLTHSELGERYRSLTDESPPGMSRAFLITTVAYETLRQADGERGNAAQRASQTEDPVSADVAR